MSIVADRGLLVRLLVSSGKFEPGEAEALADAFDAATHGPATKTDLLGLRNEVLEVRSELKTEIALLSQRVDALGTRLDARINALDSRFDDRIDALDARFDARIDAVDTRLDGLDSRFDARIDAVDTRLDALDARLSNRIDAMGDRLMLRLGGLMIALTGALFAALRLTQP